MDYDVRYNEIIEDYLDNIRSKGITAARTVEDFCAEECEPFSFNLSLGTGWGRLMDLARSKDYRCYLCYQGDGSYYVYHSGMGTIMYSNPLNPHAASEFRVTGAYADLAAASDPQFMLLIDMLRREMLGDESCDPFYEEVDLAVFARADW